MLAEVEARRADSASVREEFGLAVRSVSRQQLQLLLRSNAEKLVGAHENLTEALAGQDENVEALGTLPRTS